MPTGEREFVDSLISSDTWASKNHFPISDRNKEAADAYERFLSIAPKTDADRRARIRGLIDFLRYLGQQKSLYDLTGANRTVISFEATDSRPILLLRVNGEKTPLRFVLDTGSGMSVISETTAK